MIDKDATPAAPTSTSNKTEPLTSAVSRQLTRPGRRERHGHRGRPARAPLTAPAPAATPAAPARPPMEWEKLGRPLKALADPLYRAVGVPLEQLPTETAWTLFAIGWGGVVDHYLPQLAGSPWPGAALGTLPVLLPLAGALPEYLARRRRPATSAAPPSS